MAQKTYKQIQQEADIKFGKGASDEKFAWRQAQQRAAGLAEEKRKRGGVARSWDVGKSWMRPAAELAAGFFGGPMAATLTGAALRGFDRPGKRGIGFDVGQGMRGAAEGYVVGGLGAAGRGAMSPGTQPLARTGYDSTLMASTRGQGAKLAAQQYFQPGMASLLSGGEKVLKFARDNPTITAAGLQAGLGAYQAAQEQAQAQQEFDMQEQLRQEEQARRNRLAQLLAPAMQAQARPYSFSR